MPQRSAIPIDLDPKLMIDIHRNTLWVVFSHYETWLGARRFQSDAIACSAYFGVRQRSAPVFNAAFSRETVENRYWTRFIIPIPDACTELRSTPYFSNTCSTVIAGKLFLAKSQVRLRGRPHYTS